MPVRLVTTAILGAAIATPALAAPVYLDCVLQRPDGPQKWTLSLNEEQATVTYSHPLASGTTKAIFTPDAVTWGPDWITNRIDRSTLEFTQIAQIASERSVARGACKISTRKRAF